MCLSLYVCLCVHAKLSVCLYVYQCLRFAIIKGRVLSYLCVSSSLAIRYSHGSCMPACDSLLHQHVMHAILIACSSLKTDELTNSKHLTSLKAL